MRARRWRGKPWAAWLGLVALAVNALVPVHIAFDLAEAFAPAQHSADDQAGGAERRLLALISGHDEAADQAGECGGRGHGRHGHDHHHGCPVCSALGALAGFTPPASVALSLPPPAGPPAALPVVAAVLPGVSTGYRSRAPPLA